MQAHFDDGLVLGAQGTPTIFVDGEALGIRSTASIEAGIDRALE